MSVIKWKNQNNDPFKELFELDHPLFGLSLLPFNSRLNAMSTDNLTPAVDISEDNQAVTIKADLPGIKKEDITVSLNDGVLSIRGERKSESEKTDKKCCRVERSFGVFERHLRLGVPVDESKINASYRDGVLEITLPKSAPAEVKRINVQ